MNRLSEFYEKCSRLLRAYKRSIFAGTRHLELIASFDRKLARLSRQRDRELGRLAHSFLNASVSNQPPAQFINIINEIKRLEHERSLPIVESSTSLTALVIPDMEQSRDSKVSDMELVHPQERDDLYRRRLRGVYMDLGELILTHSIRDEFEGNSEVIEQIRTQIMATRQERERTTDLLPSSNLILRWLRAVAAFIILSVVLLVLFSV
jgi:hypothetical protein